MRSNGDGSPQVRPPTGPFTANVMNVLEGEAAPSRRTAGTFRSSASLLAALLFFFALASSFAEAGNCWTNRAGHAMKAEPQSISGQSVTFLQGGAGKAVTYPLSVFTEPEQERLRCALKDTTLPAGLKAGHEFSARVITRSRLLAASGSLSKEDCQKAIESAVSAFRKQAGSFIAQKQLSPERLELIVCELAAEKK